MAKKKIQLYPLEIKRGLVEFEHDELSIRTQCKLLGLNRSSLYYQTEGIDPYNLLLMRELDEQYTSTPFYGVRRMTAYLKNKGYAVNVKRIR